MRSYEKWAWKISMYPCYFLNGYTYNHSKVETIFYEFLLMGYLSTCSFRNIRLYQVCWDFIITLPHEMTWGKKKQNSKKRCPRNSKSKTTYHSPFRFDLPYILLWEDIRVFGMCQKSNIQKIYPAYKVRKILKWKFLPPEVIIRHFFWF